MISPIMTNSGMTANVWSATPSAAAKVSSCAASSGLPFWIQTEAKETRLSATATCMPM